MQIRGRIFCENFACMKLFNAIAAAAFAGASFIAAIPAEAQRAPNGWIFVGTTTDRTKSHYVKPLGSQGPFLKFQWQMTGLGAWNDTHLADCRGWRYRELQRTNWEDALPASIGDAALQIICG